MRTVVKQRWASLAELLRLLLNNLKAIKSACAGVGVSCPFGNKKAELQEVAGAVGDVEAALRQKLNQLDAQLVVLLKRHRAAGDPAVEETAHRLRAEPAVDVELLIADSLQGAGGHLAHEGEDVRPAEVGESLLLVEDVGFQERDAAVERGLAGQQEEAGVEVGLVQGVEMHVGGEVARGGDEATGRHRRCRGILFVIGMQYQQQVQGLDDDRIRRGAEIAVAPE